MLDTHRLLTSLALAVGLLAITAGCAPSGSQGAPAAGTPSGGGGSASSGAGSTSGTGAGTSSGSSSGGVIGGGTGIGTQTSTGGTSGGGARVPAILVSAWLPSYAGAAGQQSLADSAGGLDEVNPTWYALKADGSLTVASVARDAAFVARMHAQGTQVLPMVDDFAINGATAVLTDTVKRARLLDALVAEVVAWDLDGLDIDFEEMGAAGRDPFVSFMTDLAAEMHRRGKLLAVAVYPKTSEPGTYATQKSHNYPALGAVVDRFKIMLYSFDGPVAPLTYIESVCGFAKTQMPAAKVYAGIPFYGWDKPATGTKRSVLETSANALRTQVGAALERDAASQEARFTYTASGVLHTVYYQDAVSIGAKVDKAKAMGLGGVAIWRMGGERRETWDAIRVRR